MLRQLLPAPASTCSTGAGARVVGADRRRPGRALRGDPGPRGRAATIPPRAVRVGGVLPALPRRRGDGAGATRAGRHRPISAHAAPDGGLVAVPRTRALAAARGARRPAGRRTRGAVAARGGGWNPLRELRGLDVSHQLHRAASVPAYARRAELEPAAASRAIRE